MANESSALQYAQQNRLWEDIEWLNLVHYQRNRSSASGYVSQSDDARFFNAVDGKTSPRAELLATIEAFYQTDIVTDEHAQCRLVARFSWLKNNLGSNLDQLPAIECAGYKKWRRKIPDDKVTMIFPAYHLNSPSSMFGHNLLRLDSADEETASDWLSIAVNFGANIDENDNSLYFAFKGLTGGYPGYFIITPYFEKIKEYNRQENRDIWEYPLNLTSEETRKLVDHLWELKDIEFDYYFFDENCSYRLLELLEVARPEVELTDGYYLTAIPVDTVRTIQDANLITGINYRPSQTSVLKNLLVGIPAENHHYVLELSKDPQMINASEFQSLPQTLQKDLVNAAYRYFRYRQTNKPRTAESARTSYQLLRTLTAYPPGDNVKPAVKKTQPEAGHLSKRLVISAGSDDDRSYSELGFRVAFHGLEDNQDGFLRGAQINFGNLAIRSSEVESLQLQRLDLVDIFSLTPRNEFFQPLSWRVYSGLERQMTFGRDRLVTHITGGIGLNYEVFDNNYSYALVLLRLEHNRGFDDDITPALGLNLGSLHHFDSSTAIFDISGEHFDNSEYRYRLAYTHNFVLSRNHSIKLKLQRENQRDADFLETSLSYQYYF